MNSSATPDISAFQKLPAFLARIYKLRTEVGELLQLESTQLEAVRDRGDKSRRTFMYVLYGCCAGNVILAVTLGCLFAGSIISRLRVLMNNANCLPRNQKFPARVKGDDELAYLDGVLAEAAAQLEAAAEHRRSIIGMVAHDMRSPLMAAQASLQMIEELGVEFTDKAFTAFDTAFQNLSRILTYVKELLSVQKRGQDISDEKNAAELTATEQTGKADLLPRFVSSMHDFWTKPGVLQQGLILVALPLIFQTGILLCVNQQILRSEEIAGRARRLSDSIMAGQFIRINMVRASLAQAIYVFTGRERSQQLAERIFSEIDDQFAHIQAAAADDPEEARITKETRRMFASQRARILNVKPSDSPQDMVKLFEDMTEVNARSLEAWKLRRDGTRRAREEKARLEGMEDTLRDSAQTVSETLGWSILANLLLAVGLLTLFNSNISKRLHILVNNASKLGKRERLQEVVRGADEFASLDLCLHHAAVQIEEASAQRASMMASLAEEMRAPLRDSQARLQLFENLSIAVLPDRCRNYLTKSQRNIERVLTLIENLLTIESLSTGRVHLITTSCDTSKVAEEALATVLSLAQKKNIHLLNECVSVNISADREKLIQVLVNLLGNAIKFSPAGTSIRVTCQPAKELVRLAVRDEGPGMDEETRRNVFEKFYQAQTEQKEQGFGLGLAICKLIVESHGGTIGVESALGAGTTFWFELPKSQR